MNSIQGESEPVERGMVSVIIPTYDRATAVVRAIESVLGQTYGNVEVVVVDDGSTDKTKEALGKYDERVRYIYQDNAGVAAARNTGLRAARGDFLALLDSDDLWLPWKLQIQIEFISRFPELGMVWTDLEAVGPDGSVIQDRYLKHMYSAYSRIDIDAALPTMGPVESLGSEVPDRWSSSSLRKGDLFSSMILGNLVHTSTMLMTRERFELAGFYDEGLRQCGEDYEYHLEICSRGPVGLIEVSSIQYTIGNDDQITSPDVVGCFARTNLDTVIKWLDQGGSRITLSEKSVRKHLAWSYLWAGEQEFRSGDRSAARSDLRKSVRHNPSKMRAWAFLFFAHTPPLVFRLVIGAKRLIFGTGQ